MRIRVVVPIAHDRFNPEVLAEFRQFAAAGTEISVANLAQGPDSIESECEEALAVPDFLNKAKQAEADGCDAVICDCFGDPGVRAGREAVDIPVVGPGEASLLLAASLGQRMSVVTVLRSVFPMLHNLARAVGIADKLVSVRAVDIPVLELDNKQKLQMALQQQMREAIQKDDAHVLILGCTGMMGVAEELQRLLWKGGYEVPVVDPVAASLKLAETLVSLHLKQSRLTYMRPKKTCLTAPVVS